MPGTRSIALIAMIGVVVLLVAGGALFLLRDDDDPDDTATGTATATSTGSNPEGSPTSASGTPSGDPAQALLADAGARWDATESAQFALEVDGRAYVDSAQTIELRSANGDIARPDLVDSTVKISVALVSFDIGIIAVGDTMYQTNLVTGDWELAPADFNYNPAILFSPTDGISAVVVKVQDPALGDEEEVEGREAQVVTGTLTGDDVDAITGGAVEGDIINTTLWIATDNQDIVKIVLEAPGADAESPTTWTLVITEQNEPVTIKAPEV